MLLEKISGRMGDFLWGPPMLAVFLLTGAYLTLRGGVFPVRRLRLWLKTTFGSLLKRGQGTADAQSISQWQALTSALAACLGTGNIVGVATI